MRKPRDYSAELKALDDKAKRLKQQRVRQLGELVIACGADGLSAEQLAGALLSLKGATVEAKEGWRQRGVVFFQRGKVEPTGKASTEPDGTLPFDHAPPSA